MKFPVIVYMLTFLLISRAWADPFLIVPGRSLGRTHLGRRGADDLKKLPPPAASDAGMMQNHLVWVSRRLPGKQPDTLYIHTLRNGVQDPPGPGVTIMEIRATSRRFHTRHGISPGSTLAQIRRRFPHGQVVSNPGNFYVVASQGIAFTFARLPSPTAHCTAITVYPPGAGNDFATSEQVRDLLRSGFHS